MITFMPMLMWAAALIGTAVSLYVSSQPLTLANVSHALLRWLFVFPLGTQAIWDFVSYGFLPQTMAERFGWAPSPFQMEVAFANLGLAAASFFAAFARRPARIAVALVAACYLVGSGLSLVTNVLDGDDLAAGFAGAILLERFLTPVALLMLLFVGGKAEEPHALEGATDGARARPVSQPQQAPPHAPPQRPTLAPPGPQGRPVGQGAIRPPSKGAGRQDALRGKVASSLHERAPWEAPANPGPGRQPRSQPPARPGPPPGVSGRPGPADQGQPRSAAREFDQSLEDELERARRQMMEDLAKGRKPDRRP